MTGLIWEVKSSSGLRNKVHTYSWYNTDSTTNGGLEGEPSGGASTCQTPGRCDTAKFVNDVNIAGLCGHSDWRLPTRKELGSIIHYGPVNPTVDASYFPNTQSSLYWSGSAVANYIAFAWIFHFDSGNAEPYGKTQVAGVRLVRVAP